RSALTHIYFSLDAGERSRFHRVAGDEVWNLYEGVGIRLYLWDGSAIRPTCVVLSAEERCFCHIVPGGTWQAAEPLEGTVLVGCSVAPGFEFSDFELMDPESDLARRLAAVASDLRPLVGP
ncbi:MAG: cupin domain-containing protein, partial [Lentisphaerae bacterium]|nr:cupin domain-containing protein [Lentisphaerota bacterium]